jgi:serine/threonine protein kinase
VEEDGPMTASAILELLPQMLAGLKYIHSRTPAVVHHDFTPDNLICSTSGQLVLIDFDVAREQSTRTLATMVGKQAYTPPEQLRGQAGPASDIYALGATLYFLASGENPRPISRNSLPSARQDSPQWRILDEIISGCTILDTSNRFTIEDIERVLGRNSATAIAAAAKSSEKERSQIGDEDDDESEESRDNVAKILVRMEQKEEV